MNPLLLSLALMSPGQPPVYVQSAPVVIVPAAPMTLAEFARVFQPIPGTHRVCLIHPKTCQPVDVCFTLPCGCPKIRASKHRLEFDYGKREVEIRFRHNGKVDVDYD